MYRRMLRACLGATFVGALVVPPAIAQEQWPTEPRESSPLHGGSIVPIPEDEPKPPDVEPQSTETKAKPSPWRVTTRPARMRSLPWSLYSLLSLLPKEACSDAPRNFPQAMPVDPVLNTLQDSVACAGSPFFGGEPNWCTFNYVKWYLTLSKIRFDMPTVAENEGYLNTIHTQVVLTNWSPGASESETKSTPELLPMPREESEATTCPYLRQQQADRHVNSMADYQIGHEVMDNLRCLQEAEDLLAMARILASKGYVVPAMVCCVRAQERCAGSPCAQRAQSMMQELAFGIAPSRSGTEEAAEKTAAEKTIDPQADASHAEPGVETAVNGMLRSCYLLMGEGKQEQAAALARQAFALDPQRVMADPLFYKMHLLARGQTQSSSEESEPPSCPYCPRAGQPIRALVPEAKTTMRKPSLPPVDGDVVPALERVLVESKKPGGSEEANANEWVDTLTHGSALDIDTQSEDGLRVEGEYAVGGKVYHLRYKRGCFAIWKTTDASK